ncbi:hypothetical protein JCM10450v2_007622 [Rhodotorula kratochvilovae]
MEQPAPRASTSLEVVKDEGGDGGQNKHKIACLACRAVKMRCLPQEPAGQRCARCDRLDQECVWATPQKRGRKPKGYRPPAPTTSASSSSTSSAPHSLSDPRPVPILAFSTAPNPLDLLAASALPPQPSSLPPPFYSLAPPQPLPTSVSSYLPPPPKPVYAPIAQPLGAARSSTYDSPSTGSELSPAANLSLIDVSRAKEEALSKLSAGEATALKVGERAKAAAELSRDAVPDPIDLRILTEQEAQLLWTFFFEHLNRFIILFDKYLHTLAFVRRNSTVLFASILAVSAKFSRPDIYPQLLANAQQLVGRGIVEARASVGLVQSILALIYWKEPMDGSSWLRTGIAIRMGYQLDLHVTRTSPLPDDEHEARLIMDIERTWHVLVAFDGTYLLHSGDEDDGFHQTYMVPHSRINIQKWLEETKAYGVTDDIEQGAAFEWLKVLRLSKDIANSRPMQARALASHLQGMLEATYHRYLDPASPHSLHSDRRAVLKVTFFMAAASVALRRAVLVSAGTFGVTLAHFMVAACELVDAFEEVAKEGMVRYWQDTIAVTMFALGEFLVKIFNKVYPTNQTQILSWMERVYQACELASEGKDDSVAAFMSRFFKLGIRVLCSPAVAPAAEQPVAFSAAQAQAALAALQAPAVPLVPTSQATSMPLLPPAPPSPAPLAAASSPLPEAFTFSQSMGDDRLFWESLFPGQASDWSWLDQQPGEDLAMGVQ